VALTANRPIESIAIVLALGGMSAACPASPILYNFDSDELEKALEEQSFGITGFELLRSPSSLQSFARVTLLEGDVVNISLSARGYQLTKSGASSAQTGEVFEAIESLLQFVSPLYERMRRENLFAQLERWS